MDDFMPLPRSLAQRIMMYLVNGGTHNEGTLLAEQLESVAVKAASITEPTTPSTSVPGAAPKATKAR